MSGTAENRFLAPRNEFWGQRPQRQAGLKTGPQRFPIALFHKINAHLTFSLFLKFLGCYSELPEAPDNEEMKEPMTNQSFLTSRRYSNCLPSHQPSDIGPLAHIPKLQVSAVAGSQPPRQALCLRMAYRVRYPNLLLIFLSCS